jgi:hypothetical protein
MAAADGTTSGVPRVRELIEAGVGEDEGAGAGAGGDASLKPKAASASAGAAGAAGAAAAAVGEEAGDEEEVAEDVTAEDTG